MSSITIYAGNLHLDVLEDELNQIFTPFGEVISVIIVNDDHIGRGQFSKYAYVEMSSKTEGEAAIAALGGIMLRDRAITVIEALPLTNKKITGNFHGKNKKLKHKKHR